MYMYVCNQEVAEMNIYGVCYLELLSMHMIRCLLRLSSGAVRAGLLGLYWVCVGSCLLSCSSCACTGVNVCILIHPYTS